MMFKSADELKSVLGGFFQLLCNDPTVGPKLLASKLIVRFNYREPDALITIDLSGPRAAITFDDVTKQPIVEMSMKGDIAHHYWLGEVSLPIALARRQMIAKGPIPKILKLLPAIQGAYKLYPEYLRTQCPRLASVV